MMKCKVAIDDKNECTNCCYFCDKKDTCKFYQSGTLD